MRQNILLLKYVKFSNLQRLDCATWNKKNFKLFSCVVQVWTMDNGWKNFYQKLHITWHF